MRKFIELMNEHDLAEIDLRQGDQRIRLRRGPEMVTMSSHAGACVGPQLRAVSSARAVRKRKAAEAAADESKCDCTSRARWSARSTRPRTRVAAVCQSRRSRGPGNDRVHRRSDESLQRDPGRMCWPNRRRAGQERRRRSNSISHCSALSQIERGQVSRVQVSNCGDPALRTRTLNFVRCISEFL